MGSTISSVGSLNAGKRTREKESEPQTKSQKVRKLVHAVDHWESRSRENGPDDEEDNDNFVLNRPNLRDPGSYSEDFSGSTFEDVDSENVSSFQDYSRTPSVATDANRLSRKNALQLQSLDQPQPLAEVEENTFFPDIYEGLEILCAPALEPLENSPTSSPMDHHNSVVHKSLESLEESGILVSDSTAYPSEGSNTIVDLPNFVDPRAFFNPYREISESTAIFPTISNDSEPSLYTSVANPIILGGTPSGCKPTSLSSSFRANDEEFDTAAATRALVESTSADSATNHGTSVAMHSSIPMVEIPAAGSQTVLEGLPTKLVAERLLSGNVEYLVRTRNGAQESWMAETGILRIAPHLVKEWKAMQVEAPILGDIVEKILSKKKVKGVLHYLVKWEGYSEVKDRTWEPCDRLRVDVPSLVDEYEMALTAKKRKRKRK